MAKVNFQIQKCCLIIFLASITSVNAQSRLIKNDEVVKKNASFLLNSNFSVLGQTFVANRTGMLTSVSIKLDESTSINEHSKLHFWLEKGAHDGSIIGGKPYQIVPLTKNEYGGSKNLTISFTKPYRVVKGNTYRMQFGVPDANTRSEILLAGSFVNSYPNGALYFYDGSTKKNRDLIFSLSIASQWTKIE